jgi:hypothetical protein
LEKILGLLESLKIRALAALQIIPYSAGVWNELNFTRKLLNTGQEFWA